MCNKMSLLLIAIACFGGVSCRGETAGMVEPTVTGRGTGNAYAFSFFYNGKDGEKQGMWMAVSRDGIDWEIVNGNQVVFKRPFGTVLRDPAIAQGPDGTYHLVWTIDWASPAGVGYAHSKDLIHWEEARILDLMKPVEGTVNLWAPELVFDEADKRWMIYWGSSVEGRFNETRQKIPRRNNRMYCAFTTDFKTFTEPKVLLGDHIVNDTRIINVDSPHGTYCMVTKHIVNPGTAAELYLAFSDRIDGPYKRVDESRFDYISKPHKFCEGPAIIKIGDWYHCYFDLSREHRMACKRNRKIDSAGWEDITDRLTFPSGVKHGDVIRIPMETYEKLKALTPTGKNREPEARR